MTMELEEDNGFKFYSLIGNSYYLKTLKIDLDKNEI